MRPFSTQGAPSHHMVHDRHLLHPLTNGKHIQPLWKPNCPVTFCGETVFCLAVTLKYLYGEFDFEYLFCILCWVISFLEGVVYALLKRYLMVY